MKYKLWTTWNNNQEFVFWELIFRKQRSDDNSVYIRSRVETEKKLR